MEFKGINGIIATLLAGLLAWWLWEMGIGDQQKVLLACVGGGIMWIGFLGGMAFSFENARSGIQVRIVMNILAVVTFLACCIYSFFLFSPVGFCVPLGVFAIICLLIAFKVYESKM